MLSFKLDSDGEILTKADEQTNVDYTLSFPMTACSSECFPLLTSMHPCLHLSITVLAVGHDSMQFSQ